MRFKDFSAINRTRCEHPQGFNHAIGSWSGSDWMTALVGEIGEAANIIKKLNRTRDGVPGNKETDPVLHEKLAKELGDAGVYLDLIAQRYGLDLGECMRRVFNEKSLEIGYPLQVDVDADEDEAQSVDLLTDTYVTIGCYRETGRLDRLQSVFRRAHATAHKRGVASEFAGALASLHDHKGDLTVKWYGKAGFVAFGPDVERAWTDEHESRFMHLVLNPGGELPLWVGGIHPHEFGIDAIDARHTV